MGWKSMSSTNKNSSKLASRRSFLFRAGVGVGSLAASPTIGSAQVQDPAHVHSAAKPFVFKTEPQRLRKSFYDLTDAEIRLLCRAVGHMRNGTDDSTRTPPIQVPLSVDSPLQWDQWVKMHAQHCTESGP